MKTVTAFTIIGSIVVNAALLAAEVAREAVQTGPAQSLRAETRTDRVIVSIEGKVFTEYLFLDSEKYPYFFPVNGPRSGETVTVRRQKNYPHHSSVFFGCDRVNGGNYWQEGLDRGRIVSKTVTVVTAEGPQVVIEQDCQWERPGAEAPFTDHRRIVITAPSPDLRFIDFEVTLKARIKVKIEKTNHSLFSVRAAPELTPSGGGELVNAHGERSEKGTFGKKATWTAFRGQRNGQAEGVAIFDHPGNPWAPTPWFTRDYGFMSPTPMYWPEKGSLEFNAGDSIRLRYRVVVHGGVLGDRNLDALFEPWRR
jgi:hypothetical protein